MLRRLRNSSRRQEARRRSSSQDMIDSGNVNALNSASIIDGGSYFGKETFNAGDLVGRH